MCMLCRCELY